MGRKTILVMVLVVSCAFVFAGCGPKKADSSRQAIDTTKTMGTAQEKVDYLVGQAKAFYNSKEFQNAVDVAQYVLSSLDKNSQEAKNMLQQAKDALTAQMKTAVDSAKKNLGGLGK